MRPKVSNKTLTKLDLEKIDLRIRQLQNCKNAEDGRDNVIKMSLRLNKPMPNFQTKPEIPGIERRSRSWRERQSGIGPLCNMIVRRKPEQTFVFRKLYVVTLNFHLLT